MSGTSAIVALSLGFLCFPRGFAQCSNYSDSFKTQCASRFGILVGGRCFYVGEGTATWQAAFAKCAETGGTLAELMSAAERDAVYAKCDINDGAKWIALRTDPQVTDVKTLYHSTGMRWYKSPTESLNTMIAGNTWMRDNNDWAVPMAQSCVALRPCYHTFSNFPCTNETEYLCEYRSNQQHFTMNGDACLNEVPVDEFTASDIIDCTNRCADDYYCRSFNFYKTGKCQLFPWFMDDSPKTVIDPSCRSYIVTK